MLRYCLKKWDKNKDALRAALVSDEKLGACNYKHLVELTTRIILNDGIDNRSYHPQFCWNDEKIIEIDHGDYQGTLLYVIPMDTYQPDAADYLMTSVYYGSCSGCDTLQSLQCHEPADVIDQYMMLCKDIITNMVHPFDHPWAEELNETVVMQ